MKRNGIWVTDLLLVLAVSAVGSILCGMLILHLFANY